MHAFIVLLSDMAWPMSYNINPRDIHRESIKKYAHIYSGEHPHLAWSSGIWLCYNRRTLLMRIHIPGEIKGLWVCLSLYREEIVQCKIHWTLIGLYRVWLFTQIVLATQMHIERMWTGLASILLPTMKVQVEAKKMGALFRSIEGNASDNVKNGWMIINRARILVKKSADRQENCL